MEDNKKGFRGTEDSGPGRTSALRQGKLSSFFQNDDWRRQGERFGMGLATALAVMSALSMYRGAMARMEVLALASAVLLALAFIMPAVLYPLAWILESAFKALTRALLFILLALVFMLVFSPVGIVLRILRKDPLDQRLDPEAASYWSKRKTHDPSRAEKQF